MEELEEEILRKAEFKPYLSWKYIGDIFLLWEHGEEKLKSLIDNINKMHLTVKFTADWSKTSVNFFDATVSIAEGVMIYTLNLLQLPISFIIFLPSFLLLKRYTMQPGTKT